MSLIEAALPTVAAGVNAIASKNAQKRQNKANKELAEYQYSKDLQMWHRQNAYNAPNLQMERLKEAGLNPNMIYGTGSAAANTAKEMPKYQAPRAEITSHLPDIVGELGRFQQQKMQKAQIDNVKAQTALNIQKAATEAALTAEKGYKNQRLADLAQYSAQFAWYDWLKELGAGTEGLYKHLTLAPYSEEPVSTQTIRDEGISIERGLINARQNELLGKGSEGEYKTKTVEDRINLIKEYLAQNKSKTGIMESEDTIKEMEKNLYLLMQATGMGAQLLLPILRMITK